MLPMFGFFLHSELGIRNTTGNTLRKWRSIVQVIFRFLKIAAVILPHKCFHWIILPFCSIRYCKLLSFLKQVAVTSIPEFGDFLVTSIYSYVRILRWVQPRKPTGAWYANISFQKVFKQVAELFHIFEQAYKFKFKKVKSKISNITPVKFTGKFTSTNTPRLLQVLVRFIISSRINTTVWL